MAGPRQAVVHRWLAAGDAGYFDAFDDLLHPDAVIHAPLGLSTISAEEEKAVWREALAAMPDLRHDVQEVVVDGDVEMARVVVTGALETSFAGVVGTGRSFRMDQAVITHLRDARWKRRGRLRTSQRCCPKSLRGDRRSPTKCWSRRLVPASLQSAPCQGWCRRRRSGFSVVRRARRWDRGESGRGRPGRALAGTAVGELIGLSVRHSGTVHQARVSGRAGR